MRVGIAIHCITTCCLRHDLTSRNALHRFYHHSPRHYVKVLRNELLTSNCVSTCAMKPVSNVSDCSSIVQN